MKKMFEDCWIAVIFMTACCGIAAIMGLIKARDKKRGGKKRRPLPPTQILIYTAEWIRRITKAVAAPFRRRYDHLFRFDDSTCRLSPDMMAAVEAAPHYTMEELEGLCNPSPKIITEDSPEKILI